MSDAFLAQQNQDFDSSTVAQAMRRSDWPKWKDAMDAELESFFTLKVWEYAKLPPKVNLIKCKWIFVRKYDVNGMLKKCWLRRDSVNMRELTITAHLHPQ